MLKLKNVSAQIGGFEIIRDVSLEIQKGEFVALLGSNGAGKTTLFKTIAGVIKPYAGTIELKEKHINKTPPHEIVSMGLSLCPEGRHIFPKLSVYKNLILGAFTRQKESKKDIQNSLEQVYELFPVLKEREKQMAGTFSGGEQQMLAIARSLMSDPEILLLDEPSMGLAPKIVERISEIITTINEEFNTTIFLSEQNANLALMITKRGYVLENGKLIMEGASTELREHERVREAYLGA